MPRSTLPSHVSSATHQLWLKLIPSPIRGFSGIYIYIYTFVSAVDWRVCFPFVISDPTGNFAKRYFCGKISSSIAIFEANSFSLENSYRRGYIIEGVVQVEILPRAHFPPNHRVAKTTEKRQMLVPAMG